MIGGNKRLIGVYGSQDDHHAQYMIKPIYGKTLLPQNPKAYNRENWYVASGPWAHIIVCSNDDPRLTLTYFTARSKLVSYSFILRKV